MPNPSPYVMIPQGCSWWQSWYSLIFYTPNRACPSATGLLDSKCTTLWGQTFLQSIVSKHQKLKRCRCTMANTTMFFPAHHIIASSSIFYQYDIIWHIAQITDSAVKGLLHCNGSDRQRWFQTSTFGTSSCRSCALPSKRGHVAVPQEICDICWTLLDYLIHAPF